MSQTLGPLQLVQSGAMHIDDCWSCFTCDYVGFSGEDEHGEPCCPECGTRDGDGFGMIANDPRYRANPAAVFTKEA